MTNQHVPAALSGAIRSFAGWVIRGSVGYPILTGIEYLPILMEHPSLMEEVFAVFVNNLILDADGSPVNFDYATDRAAHHIYYFCERKLPPGVAPLEDWELFLY